MLAQIFADRDSEGEYLPSDDDHSAETSDSDTAAAPTVTPTTARVYSGAVVGEIGQGGGRGGGRGGIQNRAVVNDNHGWEYLGSEEVFYKWIRDFDEPVGYRGDKDLTDANASDFLSLFLDEDFWNLITNETDMLTSTLTHTKFSQTLDFMPGMMSPSLK